MDAIPEFRGLKAIKTGKNDGEEMMRRVNGEEEEPLSPMARLFHEPGSNVYIITVLGWKTKITPDVLKANLVQTLLKHPRFSSLQVVNEENGREIRWVQTEVNLDNHVIVPDPNPTPESPDKFVEDYVSDLSKTTVDMSKPMWDFHLLNLKTSDAEATGVLRVHHSLGDGSSLMSLLLATTQKASDPGALPTVTATKRSDPVGLNRLGLYPRMMWNSMVGVAMYVLTALFLEDTNNPLKGPPGVEFKPRRFVHRTVSLGDFKLVKNAMNTTLNDVVLGVTQAALSTYLNRRYGQGKQNDATTASKNNLPDNLRLRATFFMNLRPSTGINALGDMMEKGTKVRWGNKIGYVLLPFTIAFRDDPLAYVREAKGVINHKKNSIESNYSYFITKTILKFFGSKAVGILSHRVFSHTTLWFSNVPGPQEEIVFCGQPIAYLAPSCYGQPNALMIHVVSYVNKMTFMLSVDEETIPDPHQLCDDLEASLKLIKDAVLAPKL